MLCPEIESIADLLRFKLIILILEKAGDNIIAVSDCTSNYKVNNNLNF